MLAHLAGGPVVPGIPTVSQEFMLILKRLQKEDNLLAIVVKKGMLLYCNFFPLTYVNLNIRLKDYLTIWDICHRPIKVMVRLFPFGIHIHWLSFVH